jgi:mRNA interferase RelE/StbE
MPRAQRDLRQLDPQAARGVAAGLDRYAMTGQGDVIKLAGEEQLYRLRVGDWRVLLTYDLSSRELAVLRVLHRREAYR